MRDPRYVTARQLQHVVAVASALHEVLGITLLHNWERRGDDSFLFGIEEDVPGTPYVHLVHMDYGGGNLWSGEALDVDTLTVVDARYDGQPVDLRFVTMVDSAAGRLYEVHSRSLPDDMRDAAESAWRDALRREAPVPEPWTWLLAAPREPGAPSDEAPADDVQGRTIG